MNEYLTDLGLVKKNYKGQSVYVLGGLLLYLSGLILLLLSYNFLSNNKKLIIEIIYLITITTGAGLIDDICGSKDNQGFTGHIMALFRGEITTGIFKALTISLAIIYILRGNIVLRIIDFGVIVFITNFMNLLDLRPGRSIKFFFLISLVFLLILPSFNGYFLSIYLLLFIYLPFELNHTFMLGDSGANLLGIILGVPVIFIPSIIIKSLIFFIFLLLNLMAEKYSFTELIASNRVLRLVDMWGRN